MASRNPYGCQAHGLKRVHAVASNYWITWSAHRRLRTALVLICVHGSKFLDMYVCTRASAIFTRQQKCVTLHGNQVRYRGCALSSGLNRTSDGHGIHTLQLGKHRYSLQKAAKEFSPFEFMNVRVLNVFQSFDQPT